MNYCVKKHQPEFVFSLDYNQLPPEFRAVILSWSKRIHRDDRLHYNDGAFYVVLPFEWLTRPMANSPSNLAHYIRRLWRLDDLGDQERLARHISLLGADVWSAHNQTVDSYLDMLLLLQHLRSSLPQELTLPNTLAVFVH